MGCISPRRRSPGTKWSADVHWRYKKTGSQAQIGPLAYPATQYKEVSPSFDIVTTAKWTSDIRGWSKDKPEVQDETGKSRIPDEHMNRNEDISIYFANSRYVTFKYLYESSGFCNPQRWRRVFKYLDDALYRFLMDQRDEFTSKKGIPQEKPIADIMEAYIDGNHMLHLMLEEDEDYGAGNESMPTGMKSYFFEELFVTILRDMFSYFYLPSNNYDFRSCIKAIDYFIRNYKEVFQND